MCVVGGCNTNTAHPAGTKIQDAKDARAAIEGQVAAEVEKQQALSADLQARQQVSELQSQHSTNLAGAWQSDMSSGIIASTQ